MRWLIALDVAPGSTDTLEAAAWLAGRAAKSAFHFEAVTVVSALLHQELPSHEQEQLLERVRQAARQAVARLGLDARVGNVEVSVAETAADGLLSQARALAAGVLLRRRAGRELPALSPTGRRLISDPAGPVCFMPPALPEHSGGPVLLAVRPHADVAGALRFARTLAELLRSELAVVHALELPSDADLASVSDDLGVAWRQEQREAALNALAEFMDEHDLSGVYAAVVPGPPTKTILDVARDLRATCVVCGHRTGFGTAGSVAGSADIPVVVVPGDHAASA